MFFSWKKSFGFLFLLLSFSVSSAFAAEKYYVPPTQFNAAFQVMDLGFANIFGLFRNATGAFQFDEETQTISHLKLALDSGSLTVPNPGAGRDLAALFDTRQFPEMTFMATNPAVFKDGKAEIKGTLTVHGQSKPASFEGTLNHVGNSLQGSASVGLSLRGSFKRADFAMGDAPEIPGRFGETITLLLEVQGMRQ